MMPSTERQKVILGNVVSEYIKNAFPISSDFLKQKCGLTVSSATIRLELLELTRKGFLQKPHIASGRVPTDRGYRFFVDKLFEEEWGLSGSNRVLESFYSLFGEIHNDLIFFQEVAKCLADFSDNLAVVCCGNEEIFWKEGWNEVVKAPEFQDIALLREFTDLVYEFEKGLKDIDFGADEKIKVLIGKEAPFREKEFSIVLGQPAVFKNEKKKPTFAILGPKRMDFKKNISLIHSLVEMIENY